MTQLPRWPLRWAVVWTGVALVAGLIIAPANAADQALVPSSQVRSLLANAATTYKASVKAKASYDATAKALVSAKSKLAAANKTAAPFEAKVLATKNAVIAARTKYNAALAAREAIINPPAPTPSASPTPSVLPTPSASASPTASVSPIPSPSATALTKAQKIALKKADEVITARRIALSKAKKSYAAAEAAVVKPRSAAAKALAAQTTARTKYNSAVAAKTAAEASYLANLSALNAITSVTPYSGDVCLPGQRLGEETVWECGVVKYVSDGDTIVVTTSLGKAIVVRTLGVQAPEVAHLPTPAMCGGDEAEVVLAKQLPIGTEVQLRSIAQGSYNDRTTSTRYYRSIYKRATDGTFSLDTADKLFASGLAMWFPIGLAPGSGVYEPASFARYRTLVENAARARKGLWSTTYCADPTGTTFTNQRDISPQIWAEMNPSGTDTADNEYVLVKNPSTVALDLTGWKIRDTALNFFTFPKGSILRPGHVAKIYVGRGTNNLTTMTFYFQTTGTMFLNFSQSLYDTKGWLLGDGVFLVDRQGPKGSGGNTRAWFHYPCLINGNYSESCPTLTTETSQVPNVVAVTEAAAKTALTQEVLRAKVVYATTTPENVGKVLSQSVAAGTEVEWDTLITITVGIATPVVPTPTPSPTATPSPSTT